MGLVAIPVTCKAPINLFQVTLSSNRVWFLNPYILLLLGWNEDGDKVEFEVSESVFS